jgi:serine/threonine protein kinase
VADFGLTVEGTSKGPQTTHYGRGTCSYRAPELVNPDHKNTFTNKVDIWAAGCVFFELIFRTKAFLNDFNVHQYYLEHLVFKRRFKIPEDRTNMLTPNATKAVSDTIHNMLEIDPARRPTAKELYNIFETLLLNSIKDSAQTPISETCSQPNQTASSPALIPSGPSNRSSMVDDMVY